MSTSLLRHVFAAAAMLAILIVPRALAAQENKPPNADSAQAVTDSLPFRSGQWGVEFEVADGVAGVGALRFRSPRRAWLLQASFFTAWSEREDSFSGEEPRASAFVQARLGPRRYRPLGRGAGTYFGFGGIGGYAWSRNGDSRNWFWHAGVFAELGGLYFVTRRLSLGAQVSTYATFEVYESRSPSPPALLRDRGVRVQLERPQIVGALYF